MNNFSITWHHQDRIVLVRLIGKLSPAEMREADRTLTQDFLDVSQAEKTHVIFDHSQLESIPPAGMHNQFSFTGHPHLGWCVSFGDNRVTRFYVTSLSQQNRVNFHMEPASEDALEFLQEMDNTLPTQLPPIPSMGRVTR